VSRDVICPFCGLHPYEYVHNGVGMERVAVNCCDFGALLFDWRTSESDTKTAWRIADELGDMPHGEERYQRAADLLMAAFNWEQS
jgi:hypothetical protein